MTETAGNGGGVALRAMAGLSVSLDSLAGELRAERARHLALASAVHWFTIPPNLITISSGAGRLRAPTIYGPRQGKWWDIRRISCTDYTAGTVTVYQSHTNAETLALFSTAGVLTNGKAQVMLAAGDTLAFNATGVTLASGAAGVTVSIAGIEIDAGLIGDYLI